VFSKTPTGQEGGKQRELCEEGGEKSGCLLPGTLRGETPQ